MKITKSQLKQIIKEELEAVMAETSETPGSDASINRAKLVNQASDRIRAKIKTLPGVGGGADLSYNVLDRIAGEAYRIQGGDSEKVLKFADRLGDHIIKVAKPEIKDGKLDPRVVNFVAKNLLTLLKKKQSTQPKPAKETPAQPPSPRRTVVQGELGKLDIKTRVEGGYFIATVTNKDGVSAEGKTKIRGNRGLARSSALARARAALLRKLQEQ